MRSLMVERVAVGERQAERFPVAGEGGGGGVTTGKRLAERHLVVILSFAAAVPRSSGLFWDLAGWGSQCH